MRWRVRSDRPIAKAMARPVQCVTAPGGSRKVRSTTACTLACGTGGVPGGRLIAQQTVEAFLGKALLPAPCLVAVSKVAKRVLDLESRSQMSATKVNQSGHRPLRTDRHQLEREST